jgi:hypothetical protein
VRVELQEEAERRRVAGGEEGQQAGRRRRHRLVKRTRAALSLGLGLSELVKLGQLNRIFSPKFCAVQ